MESNRAEIYAKISKGDNQMLPAIPHQMPEAANIRQLSIALIHWTSLNGEYMNHQVLQIAYSLISPGGLEPTRDSTSSILFTTSPDTLIPFLSARNIPDILARVPVKLGNSPSLIHIRHHHPPHQPAAFNDIGVLVLVPDLGPRNLRENERPGKFPIKPFINLTYLAICMPASSRPLTTFLNVSIHLTGANFPIIRIQFP
ncbi:uncharacterized protein BDR25DRAFT_354478 [Lindgomyces ingoldianus]|uniref:Uncharacterized protein n=1 Tax=Lindgomyces ingoldianus TaxID=673940 RepID=A0ACB6QY66_9PLEO|nr:uncharacterized protein BDR25DRAFT_354478 [Lindgomyces ingoldianus]KAF2471222.1 hypothetical protein BDR25DRAFT_354478 [Lindgomyces ingoldianus]